METVQHRIRRLRQEQGLTQDQMVEEFKRRGWKSSRSAFQSWERGRRFPRGRSLQKLADVYGCSIAYILNGEEPTPEPDAIAAPPPPAPAERPPLAELGSALTVLGRALVEIGKQLK